LWLHNYFAPNDRKRYEGLSYSGGWGSRGDSLSLKILTETDDHSNKEKICRHVMDLMSTNTSASRSSLEETMHQGGLILSANTSRIINLFNAILLELNLLSRFSNVNLNDGQLKIGGTNYYSRFPQSPEAIFTEWDDFKQAENHDDKTTRSIKYTKLTAKVYSHKRRRKLS
jgi:hypothetical protein